MSGLDKCVYLATSRLYFQHIEKFSQGVAPLPSSSMHPTQEAPFLRGSHQIRQKLSLELSHKIGQAEKRDHVRRRLNKAIRGVGSELRFFLLWVALLRLQSSAWTRDRHQLKSNYSSKVWRTHRLEHVTTFLLCISTLIRWLLERGNFLFVSEPNLLSQKPLDDWTLAVFKLESNESSLIRRWLSSTHRKVFFFTRTHYPAQRTGWPELPHGVLKHSSPWAFHLIRQVIPMQNDRLSNKVEAGLVFLGI